MRVVVAVASVVGLLTLSGCQLCLLPCYLCAGSTSGATLASAPLPPAPSPEQPLLVAGAAQAMAH